MGRFSATSAVFFHAGPDFLSPVLWGVPMVYVPHQGQSGVEQHVDHSVRSYPVLEGPVEDPHVPGTVWYRVDISAESGGDIADAWLPSRPGSEEKLGRID